MVPRMQLLSPGAAVRSCALVLLLLLAGVDATTFRIGVLAKRGSARALEQWSPTFTTYLNQQLPHHNFITVPLGFNEVFPAVAQKDVDFLFANPSYFACVEREFGVTAAATMVNDRRGVATSSFAGVVFTRSNATHIRTLADVSNRIFEVVDYSSLGGFQMAWREFDNAGLNPFIFPKELRFANTHDNVVHDVLAGTVDIGTVRTDTLERMAASGAINIDDIYVLTPQNVTADFPFARSTALYPEWPLAVLPHVPSHEAVNVTRALFSLPPSSNYTKAGQYFGWITTKSYFVVQQMLEDIGFLLPTGFCRTSSNLYDGLYCPDGYHKLPTTEFNSSKTSCGAVCPPDRTCLCRSCRKIVKASLSLSSSLVHLGGSTNSSFTVSLPTPPLRDVKLNVSVTAWNFPNSGSPTITGTPSVIVFTSQDWATPQAVTLVLHPRAVTLGVQDAAAVITVQSNDPDYADLQASVVDIAVRWPQCSSAHYRFVLGTCNPITLTQTVRYEWVAPLDTDDGTTILPSDCAGGTDLPPPLELPCQRVSLESPVAIVVGALVLLLLLADCCAAAFVWHRRRVRRGIIQRSQPAFLLALCAGASFGYGYVLLMPFSPSAFTCRLMPVMLFASYTVMIGALVVKSYRVHRILNNRDITKRVILTTSRMLLRYIALLAAFAAVVMAWMLIAPPDLVNKAVSLTPSLVVQEDVCTLGNGLFVLMLVLMDAALTVSGLYLAWKVRHLDIGFAESRWMAASLFSYVAIHVVVMPIFAAADISAIGEYLLFAPSTLLGVSCCLWFIMGPKIFFERQLMASEKYVTKGINPVTTAGSKRGGKAGRGRGHGSTAGVQMAANPHATSDASPSGAAAAARRLLRDNTAALPTSSTRSLVASEDDTQAPSAADVAGSSAPGAGTQGSTASEGGGVASTATTEASSYGREEALEVLILRQRVSELEERVKELSVEATRNAQRLRRQQYVQKQAAAAKRG